MQRQPLDLLLKRAARLRCPRCGDGPLFAGFFRMHERCENCNLKYERAPGYFLGSTYINYGLTALLSCVLYLVLHFGMKYDNRTLTPLLLAICVGVPTLFFRYARSLWMSMDCFFDPTGFETDDGETPTKRT